MYLFLLLLFPCAFAWYVAHRFSALRPYMLVSVSALVLAGLVCAFRAFYLFRTPYEGANLLYFLVENWISCVVCPLVAFALFLLLARHALREKIALFALFMLPFYAVYLPAEIFAAPVPLPFFALFVKPVLYLVMVVAVGAELRTISEVLAQKGSALALSAIVCLVELVAPACIETLWYYAFPAALWCVLAVAYVALCAFRSQIVFALKDEIARSAQKEAVPRHE